jgi:hypothetical protein
MRDGGATTSAKRPPYTCRNIITMMLLCLSFRFERPAEPDAQTRAPWRRPRTVAEQTNSTRMPAWTRGSQRQQQQTCSCAIRCSIDAQPRGCRERVGHHHGSPALARRLRRIRAFRPAASSRLATRISSKARHAGLATSAGHCAWSCSRVADFPCAWIAPWHPLPAMWPWAACPRSRRTRPKEKGHAGWT